MDCSEGLEEKVFQCVRGLSPRLCSNMNQLSIPGGATHPVIHSKALHEAGFVSCYVFQPTEYLKPALDGILSLS